MISSSTDLSGLNDKQREAVVSDEKRLLVLAGAGAGKTKTLLHKITYLIEEKRAHPSSILAITFTKNAANEMIDRLLLSVDTTGEYASLLARQKTVSAQNRVRNIYKKKYGWIDSLTINTIHGFCYYVLRYFGVNEFDNKFRILDGKKKEDQGEFEKMAATETSSEILNKVLKESCGEPEFLLKLKRYILDYYVDCIDKEGRSKVDHYPEGKFFTTLNGTKVRSKSEQFIADWFYRHRIVFEYEPPLIVTAFEFHPDFHIPQGNFYLEHVSDKSYPTKDKEEQFRIGNLDLVKTYESFTRDSTEFNRILDSIVKSRLPEDFDYSAAHSFSEEFNGYHKHINDFIRQIIRIIDMIKVEDFPWEKVLRDAAKDQHERVRIFYELANVIVDQYFTYCINRSYLDFNDLITRTIALFEKYPDVLNKFRNKFQYILIDEFQDVNSLQVKLTKLMLTPTTQLFCVGDDWQSIYGFRGSNVSYIVEFEKHFPNAKVITYNLNYRSTRNIVELSNNVMEHNKFKVHKEITARKDSNDNVVVYLGNSIEENVEFCQAAINDLLLNGMDPQDILFLYRRSDMIVPYRSLFGGDSKVGAKTIHGSKGLEARAVFILGLTDGWGGFPDIWLGDRIFQVIKRADHDILLEEERRLFYVAITRAKERLFLITEKGKESSFLNEIPDNLVDRQRNSPVSETEEEIRCPECGRPLSKSWARCPFSH